MNPAFVIFPGKYKALGLNVQTSQARSVLLRPRALYFPVQITKAGCIPLVLALSSGLILK